MIQRMVCVLALVLVVLGYRVVTTAPPDPCEQRNPYEADAYAPSRFHWGPDGHCYSETSYSYLQYDNVIQNLSCPAGQAPRAALERRGFVMPNDYAASECLPGVSYHMRMTRDQWDMHIYFKDPASGRVTAGRSDELNYWRRYAGLRSSRGREDDAKALIARVKRALSVW